MVFDHLAAEFENENISVACVYLNHKEAEEQTPAKLLSGLWRQLVFRRDLGSQAKKLYHQHHEKHTSPSLEDVFNVLCSTIAQYSKVHIIVDAIDEYTEAHRRILLEYLAVMGPTVNLMITSRPHISPESCLRNLSLVEIRANEDDVRRYVDAQISLSSRLSKHVQNRPDLREEIHSKITRSVDGM
jgi:DNA-binding transcriptional regulator YdaS (Cro superfamily)